jgi:hypothetical protein
MYDRRVLDVFGQNPMAARQQSDRQRDKPNALGDRHPSPAKRGTV